MIPNNTHSQKDIIYQERIRQARWGFNLAFAYTSASVAVTLYSIILLLTGHVSQGIYTSVGGFTSNALCIKLYRDVNDNLNKLVVRPLENQSDKLNEDVDYQESNDAVNIKNDVPEDTDSDALTNTLEKLEQAILEEKPIVITTPSAHNIKSQKNT